MDEIALSIIVIIALIIIPLGTMGVHLIRYAEVQAVRLEAYSRLQAVADVITAYADNTFTSLNPPDYIYAIEYTSTTATITPRIKLYADHITYNGIDYNISWWEVWEQSATPSIWVGLLFMTPANGDQY